MSEPGPVNLGGDKIDMYPGATFDAAQLVHDAGSVFGDVWPGLLGAIRTAEGQLGNGPLGAPFREQYNSFEASVTPVAEQVQATYEGLGQAGAKAVATYLELDQQVVPARFRMIE